ncbi:MAG: DNA polymerase III subunit alpha [Bacteroidota bacterium]|nr:DNA polymerase III subunit alpha [Bacteroidota bacterium]
MYLIFDTETTGLPRDFNAPLDAFDNWPRLVQLAWQVHNIEGKLIDVQNYIIKPEGFNIPLNAQEIHGISTERAEKEGEDLHSILDIFQKAISKVEFIVGHNIVFDNNIVGSEFLRLKIDNVLVNKSYIDTKNEGTEYCKIPGGKGGKYKWPSLIELYKKLFNEGFQAAHNAAADVAATARCFLEMIRVNIISHEKIGLTNEQLIRYQEINSKPFDLIGLNIKESLDSNNIELDSNKSSDKKKKQEKYSEITSPFSHLHVHSQFSVLQATGSIPSIVDKAVDMNMPAIAITDHANMFSAFYLINTVYNHPINNGIRDNEPLNLKPIVGCELNICEDHTNKSVKDFGSQQPFLCKNIEGYKNLSKLSSLSFINGFYYIPRVDKKLILKYKEGLVAISGSSYGPVPSLILNVGDTQAEEEFKWWADNFGDNFFVEINKHGLDKEDYVNKKLISFAKKYNVKIIATNNVYYLNQEDAKAHDILLCVKEGELEKTPIGKGRGFRHGFDNDQYYFKSQKEMCELFIDLPEAIDNISYLVDQIESFLLNRDVLLPNFEIPKIFLAKKQDNVIDENEYLRYLTYEGAKERYIEISKELEKRIDFELETIKKSGYPGYFLIVQDFISQARKMNVSVGPGRGSAAGSVVAYCTGITNIDPIKYNLLFERFLNPERISLPDIDIDFDDEGRGKVIEWVVNKYGQDKVAQIITYGSMAARSSIRDTARVLDLPLIDADRVAKLVPEMISLNRLFNFTNEELKTEIPRDQQTKGKELISLAKQEDLIAETIKYARQLEGSIRNVGTHACGIIIAPNPLLELLPITNSKDSDLFITQFDNDVVEQTGLLKMDFLGLKNLTIIKDCVKIVYKLHNIDIDINNLPLDDKKTFALFQAGKTRGIFQFSSKGMRSHLKQLKPDKFNDLIAMNALYRPGPMEYIPNYIKRKHGKENIQYDLPEMEEYLVDTYGITIYQEQVMQLSQKLAGFTKGEADSLRKGMGKKIRQVIDKLRPKFISGCMKNGFDKNVVNKIWQDWEKFSEYAFNKSHSTCYAMIAYQTAYLKANFSAELMAALLTSYMRDIKDITYYMEECKSMGLKVLGPDVNESFYKFSVNKNSEIRFGLGAIKGVGEGAVQAIVDERKLNGDFTSFDNFVTRVDLRAANKRTLESIAYAGGFDSFDIRRSQYFFSEEDQSYIERMIKFGNKIQDDRNSSQFDMFGEINESTIQSPNPPDIKNWGTMEMLSKEKEVVGIYLSGHPLDDYKLEINSFCNSNLSLLNDMDRIKGKDLKLAGVVVEVEHKETKNGKKFGVLHLEDYHSSFSFYIFSNDYIKFQPYLQYGWALMIRGKVQKRYYDDNLEFKISSIELLSDLMDNQVRDAILQIHVQNISDKFVSNITKLVNNNRGKHGLILNVVDQEKKYEINLLSRNHKINLDKNFFEQISTMDDVKIKIK